MQMKGEFLTKNKNFIGSYFIGHKFYWSFIGPYIVHFVRLDLFNFTIPRSIKFLLFSTKNTSTNDLTLTVKFNKF